MMPWAKVGCDLFTYQSQAHLIVVDYFSEFWEIEHLTETKSATVIRKLKQTFARHGVPQIVVYISDNGPQFSSKEFQCFANEWHFAHVTSSPRNPQSNGRVEGAVKAAKSLITKSGVTGQDVWLGLLALRNTPTTGMSSSPVERLMSRQTRTPLNVSSKPLQPRVIDRHHGKMTARNLVKGKHTRGRDESENTQSIWKILKWNTCKGGEVWTIRVRNRTF